MNATSMFGFSNAIVIMCSISCFSLDFILVWLLRYNSVSITSLTIFEWTFLLPCFVESFTLAKVDIMFSRWHVFMKWISASISINRVFGSSNVHVTVTVSCPCFFLTCLNLLQQVYSLIIHKYKKFNLY